LSCSPADGWRLTGFDSIFSSFGSGDANLGDSTSGVTGFSSVHFSILFQIKSDLIFYQILISKKNWAKEIG